MSSHGDVKENVSGCFFSEHSVYIVVNDNRQRRMLNSVAYTPKKRTIITKLATPCTMTIIMHVHNSQLKMEHWANTNDSSNLF